ncbi:MAG: response regulator transcription factor [Sphingobacterium sp.]|nr:response regulator transcription factor [Sphingobacterium sp.]
MIVDDSLRARCALKALLSQQAGINVTAEAPNGQEAIQSISKQKPDTVLMDIRMPVMDGLDATKAIKARWPQIKIVILTMYPEYQTEALAAGADAFLMKGCSLEEIIKLAKSSQGQEAGYSLFIHRCYLVSIPPQI